MPEQSILPKVPKIEDEIKPSTAVYTPEQIQLDPATGIVAIMNPRQQFRG